MREEGSNKVSWNTAQTLIAEIGRLRTMVNSYYIKKDIAEALRCLSAIKMCVVHSLNNEEEIALGKFEVEINHLIHMAAYYKEQGGFKTPKEYYNTLVLLDQKFTQFNNQLQKLLEKYGYLIQKQEDKTKLIA